MKSGEFWAYERQLDLEAFSSNEFFSILSKQSRDVTSSIARQKDQVLFVFSSFVNILHPLLIVTQSDCYAVLGCSLRMFLFNALLVILC